MTFRNGKEGTDAVANLYLYNMNTCIGKIVVEVFLDIEKAYDNINIKKLYNYTLVT